MKETHEKLKVGDRERLNCYYAHAEDSDGLQRRCYWILDSYKEDVVLVHYLCSTTSRAGPRGSAAAAAAAAAGVAAGQAGTRGGGGTTGIAAAASRPRRAAAQRARYAKYGDYEVDSDEEYTDQARSRRQSGDGAREHQQEAAASRPGTNFPSGVEFNSVELLDTNILGRYDSKLEGIPSLQEGGNLLSLAEQDAAARNAGRGLDEFLIAPTAGGADETNDNVRRGTAGGASDIGLGTGAPLPFTNSLRKLAHDMMGSGNESLLLQTNMSLGIVDIQDGVPGDLNRLSSRTIDTSGMFGSARSGSGGLSTESPDSKSKLREDLGLEAPSGRSPVISGEPVVLDSFVVGTVGREVGGVARNSGGGVGGGEDVSGQLASEMSLEMGDTIRMNRLGSSFGVNASFGSMELGGTNGDGTEGSGKATAAREAAEVVDKDRQKKPNEVLRSTLHHQESSVATKGAAAEPKVETLRRLMAPGFRNHKGLVDSGSLADMARRTGGSDEDTGAVAGTDLTSSGGRHQRKNPTATPPPLSGHKRVAAAAAAATAATAEHREERLHQLRQARQGAIALGTTNNKSINDKDDDEDQLIETSPNPLFRLTSHVVHASAENLQALAGTGNDGHVVQNCAHATAAEKATTLMKEMSIDQTGVAEAAAAAAVGGFDAETVADAGLLMRNMSIDERTTPVDDEEKGEEEIKEAAERIEQLVEGVDAPAPSEVPKNAFGSDQEAITPSTTATTTSHEYEPTDRDPSLSSLLDLSHQQQRVPSSASPGDGGGSGAAGGEAIAGEGSEDVLLAAFAVHRSRAAAKAAGLRK